MIKNEFVEWEVTGSIGILTINNPPKNFIKTPDFIDIESLIKLLEKYNIKGLIITGGKNHFSAGADKENLYKMAMDDKILMEKLKKGAGLLKFISELDIPVIAGIKGACFGGGLELALSAHIRICSKNSLFSFPETEIGLIPGLNGTLRLPSLIGNSKALEMILSGEIINAEKALELNLVDYIVDTKDVFSFSLNFIKKLTDNRDLKVINYVIKSMNNYKKMPIEDAMNEELKMFTELAVIEAKKFNKNN